MLSLLERDIVDDSLMNQESDMKYSEVGEYIPQGTEYAKKQ